MNVNDLVIYCLDIGAVMRLGWARLDRLVEDRAVRTGSTLPELAEQVAVDLDAGRPVALGFEAPLFIPAEADWQALTRMRRGEGRGGSRNYPWSAGAGKEALFASLPVLIWVLHAVRQHTRGSHRGLVSWHDFLQADAGLGIWEAFVTGPMVKEREDRHPEDDMRDATAGAQALDDRLRASPEPQSDVVEQGPVYSLAGAALLRTGWSEALVALSQQCLVIQATKPARLIDAGGAAGVL